MNPGIVHCCGPICSQLFFPERRPERPATYWKKNLPASAICVTAWRTMKPYGNFRRKIRPPVHQITTARCTACRRHCNCCAEPGKICWKRCPGSVRHGMGHFWPNRFNALATLDGLLSFTGRQQLTNGLNIRRSREVRKLLRGLGQQKIIQLTSHSRIVAIIGSDFIRILLLLP